MKLLLLLLLLAGVQGRDAESAEALSLPPGKKLAMKLAIAAVPRYGVGQDWEGGQSGGSGTNGLEAPTVRRQGRSQQLWRQVELWWPRAPALHGEGAVEVLMHLW